MAEMVPAIKIAGDGVEMTDVRCSLLMLARPFETSQNSTRLDSYDAQLLTDGFTSGERGPAIMRNVAAKQDRLLSGFKEPV